MNREEKAAAVAEIAEQIKESDAVFAVDYRGISVTQVAELRAQAARGRRDLPGRQELAHRARRRRGRRRALKELLTGPTALTFVRGDAASAAKAIATFNRETQLLAFKGGVMDGETLEVDEIKAIAKLPSRDVLYGQLVGIVAVAAHRPRAQPRRPDRRPGDRARPAAAEEGVRRGAGGRAARGGRGSGGGAEAPARHRPRSAATPRLRHRPRRPPRHRADGGPADAEARGRGG